MSFTANILPSTATGTVQFKIDGNNFGSPVPVTAGSATSGSTSSLTVGDHIVRAVYSGDNNFTGSTGTLTQTVSSVPTATTVTSNQNPSFFGQPVTFTATVTSGTPTGTVTFKDGMSTLGTGTLNASGQATFTTSLLSAGTHSITVVYNGDNNFSGSTSPAITQVVNRANTATEAFSDGKGYFQMSVPTPPIDPRGDLPGTDDLVVEYGDSVIYRRTNTLLPDGAVHFIIDADRGKTTEKDDTHKLRLSSDELANTQSDRPTPVYDSPVAVTVPTSIRVGSTCPSKLTCSVFTVYTLDTYTRLGLDDEWISSWNANSLKAGAIAFRNYGAYYVFHPLTANYDICNTTSCQVMDPSDSAASTDNATTQTTGSVVTDASGNSVFFAEYAAENNLGGCPDGFTGNNGTWPCLSDTVDAGQTFNGHGRGMCQWGTQRWSINQGKAFVWIVNHYYNGNGSPSGLRSGYLQLSAATLLPPPTLTPVGTTTAPGQALAVTTPTFEWQPVAGADGYGLYISKFNGSTYDLIFNSETAVGQPLTGTSFTLPDGFLQMNAQYRWNMSSHTSFGYGTANVFRNYFYITPPATIAGRIFTSDGVTGLRSGTVNMTDPQGVKRSVTTSSFGYYTFVNVATGPQYTINISSRRFRFQPQTVTVAGDVSNLDFVGLE